MDGRNTFRNLERCVILVFGIKITFRAFKYIKQRRQTIESIFTSNQSSTNPFLQTSKDHIYITFG